MVSRFIIGLMDLFLCLLWISMAVEGSGDVHPIAYAICILYWGACAGLNFYMWHRERKIKKREASMEKLRFEIENKIY